MEPKAEVSSTTPAPTPVPDPTPSAEPTATTPPVVSASTTSEAVKSGDAPKGDKKKPILIAVVLLIILVIVGAIGYYMFVSMKSKPKDDQTSYVAPTTAPTVTPIPTQDPNAINDDSQIDSLVKDIDSASIEANMTKEVNSLKTDSNF